MKLYIFKLALLLTLSTSSLAYLPFFDNDVKTNMQPDAPVLTSLDKDVLSLCGGWGSKVSAREFESMLLKSKHSQSLKSIKQALSNRIFTRTNSDRDFVSQLSKVWFKEAGFAHVFCGEPGHGRDLGGLHYAPRYLQAQQKGWAGYRKLKNRRSRLRKCQAGYVREKTNNDIYNISVSFDNPKRSGHGVKCLSGYHLKMDAQKLLIAGTQAFKQANKNVGPNAKEACLVETKVDGVDSHYSTMVIKNRSLRTFYAQPDKKPYCRKNRSNFKACLCSNLSKTKSNGYSRTNKYKKSKYNKYNKYQSKRKFNRNRQKYKRFNKNYR